MSPTYTFTSESVTEGHPDKMADQISDAILDALIATDPNSRVACETFLTTGLCLVSGEIRTKAWVDIAGIVRETICGIGYDRGDIGFDGNVCGVVSAIGEQSSEVALGVDNAPPEEPELMGAGDQGLVFGYACRDTETLMPMPIHLAHRMAERLAEVRRAGAVPYLRPDGKTQVSVRYEGAVPVDVETVIVSAQHSVGIDLRRTIEPDMVEHVINPVLRPLFPEADPRILVNPTGKFVMGGPVPMPVSRGGRSSWTPMAGWPATAAAPSAARIPPRSTGRLPTPHAGRRRTWLPRVQPIVARSRSPIPSPLPSLSR